jgi:hypothetical protein
MIESTMLRILAVATLATAGVACVVDADGRSGGGGTSTATPGPGATSGGSSTPPTSVAPILVEVDTNKTMTAAPGDGVGVFVEYAQGGKWHIWWTCDTNKTGESCDFRVKATTSTGSIKNAKPEKAGDTYLDAIPNSTSVGATTITTNQVHGMTFETTPGATVTVDASVGAYHDSSFLFFVQDGKVNGGFTGRLTNPLQFVGKTP